MTKSIKSLENPVTKEWGDQINDIHLNQMAKENLKNPTRGNCTVNISEINVLADSSTLVTIVVV